MIWRSTERTGRMVERGIDIQSTSTITIIILMVVNRRREDENIRYMGKGDEMGWKQIEEKMCGVNDGKRKRE